MRQSIVITVILAASLLLACRTGRSSVDMADELSRLEKDISEAEAQLDRASGDRGKLEREIEARRALYERARLAYERRDSLQAELEAAGYSPATAEAYATVTAPGDGQVRRETPVATTGGTGTSTSKETPSRGSLSRYTGPHTIHVVAEGEYLYKIASYGQYYGDGEKWPVIYEANGYQIKDPHWIFAGQRLQIPIQ
jgi:nucleoid-associated protein YgaU